MPGMTTTPPRRYAIHPYKFNMWLFLLSVIMVFGGLTSAYVVARSMVKQPEYFDLPGILWNNTAIILFSSATMQYAVWAVRKGLNKRALAALGMTLVLGLLFMWGQWYAYGEMVAAGNFFVDPGRIDDSVSFFYVLTGLHAFHIASGILVLLGVMLLTLRNRFKPGGKVLTYEISAIFWHFLDLLWVYLFLFLLLTQG